MAMSAKGWQNRVLNSRVKNEPQTTRSAARAIWPQDKTLQEGGVWHLRMPPWSGREQNPPLCSYYSLPTKLVLKRDTFSQQDFHPSAGTSHHKLQAHQALQGTLPWSPASPGKCRSYSVQLHAKTSEVIVPPWTQVPRVTTLPSA